ncbi:MAG TPA: HDOD domain-containing protein [Steroidobacteraceae bacterium]|nr:HDOD domain-containing protein [Steroidobacteraceae bacterium]
MSSATPAFSSPEDTQEAFLFVQALAAELSAGELDLPGFPDIVARIRLVLADESVSPERVARVVSGEPVVTARLLRMANSAALNPSGKPIVELRTAILRVGFNTVRSASIAFAVQQLRSSSELQGLERPLAALWERTALVASLCYVIARRRTQLSADTALLAGLLQSLGRLYILSRASRHRTLFTDAAAYQAIERDWHLSVACAILEHWSMPEEIVAAVRDSEDFAREPRGAASLTDVLIAATLIAAYQNQPELLEVRLQSVRSIARLQLNRAQCEALIGESAQEIASLREALG